MKTWLFVLLAVICVSSFSQRSRSVESPGIRNPAGYGTIPPSTYRSGLVSSPNPIDPTGNLLMTGNVRRGMHFRGSVPYRSTTGFSGTLGSSALDSFLRDTAGSEDFGVRSNKYRVQPFYSRTQTVTTMVPGRSEVFNPMGMRINDRVRQGTSIMSNGLLGLESLPQQQTSLSQDTDTSDLDYHKFQSRYPSSPPSGEEIQQAFHSERSRGISQVESLAPGQLGIRRNREASPKGKRDMSSDRTQDRIRDENGMKQDLSTDLDQPLESDVVDLQRQQNLSIKDVFPEHPDELVSMENLKSRLEMLKSVSSTDSEAAGGELTGSNESLPERSPQPTTLTRSTNLHSLEGQDRSDLIEQIRKQLDALSKSVEAGLQEDVGEIGSSKSAPQLPESLSPSRNGRVLHDISQLHQLPRFDTYLGPVSKNHGEASLKPSKGVGEVGILSTVSSINELKTRGNPDLSTNTERIKEPYENLESFSRSRFIQHMSAAEKHLKAGRYYRAVDSFTLASVYQPNNPDVLAGKGHALFAAGEYMSSALFLARALSDRSDYTKEKVDLSILLGGAEKLNKRITDVEQWLTRSSSAQLHFLLSYVYFHTGRLNQAKQAIAATYEKMPNSPAVVTLRTAINKPAK